MREAKPKQHRPELELCSPIPLGKIIKLKFLFGSLANQES